MHWNGTKMEFYYNIKRIIEFIPYVWRHRDWDYSYILKFNAMLHKRLYKGIYTNGHHIYTEKQSRRLKAIINLYERLDADSYYDYDAMEKKYGPYVFTETGFGRSKPIQDMDVYKKDLKRYRDEETTRRNQDLSLLFYLINKYHTTFWD